MWRLWTSVWTISAVLGVAQPVGAGTAETDLVAPGRQNAQIAASDTGESIHIASGRRRVRHTVEPGDTLSELAFEYGVTVEDIQRWNDLDSDFIRVGQILTIRSSSRRGNRGGGRRTTMLYIVERGDTLSRIAHRYDVTIEDLVSWNRGIEPDMIRPGQEIRIRVDRNGYRSSSIGRPNRGRLSLAEQLRAGSGFHVRTPSRAYGTRETVRFIHEAFGRMHRRYPDAPLLTVGDLSYQRGGRMRPHVSHQSGRDADIAYYTLGQSDRAGFVRATPENLDVRSTWYLLKSFIDTGAIQYIFIDYPLQAVLYDYVRSRGASAEELAQWFQYPRDNGTRGIIRHARGHDDHFHIRFECPPGDRRCMN